MRRVWKPLDVGGLRLYEVRLWWHPVVKDGETDKLTLWRAQQGTVETHIVAATAPRHAAEYIERIYKESYDNNPNISFWHVKGFALNVAVPEDWKENGVPCPDCEPDRFTDSRYR